MNTIQKLLSDWGRGQQQLPPNNQALKSEILNKLPATQASAPSPVWRLPWLSFAFTALAIFVFFISLPRQKTLNPLITDTSQQIYQAPAQTNSPTKTVPQAAAPQNNLATPQKSAETLNEPSPATNPPANAPAENFYAPTAAAPQAAAPQNSAPAPQSAAVAPQAASPQNAATAPQRSPTALNKNSAKTGSSQSATQDNLYFPTPVAPPIQNPEIPSTDTREYLKTDYSAGISTRNVQKLDSQLQTTIRGFGGRVDSNNSTPDFGSISFVIPADQLSAFKEEIKSIAGARFYTEQTSSENLLPQKKDIEQQQTDNNNTLTQLNSSRSQLTQNHNKTVAALNSQISAANTQLSALQNEYTNDVSRELEIVREEQDLQNQISALQTKLANENANYANQLQNLNWQIQSAQNTQTDLNQQTSNLLDTVATVRGTITINWISFWDMLNLYFPLYWLGIIFAVAAIVTYIFHRRRWQMIIS